MRLRRARLSDLPALIALEREFPGDRLSNRSFRHLLERANAEVWVCEERGVLLGDAVVLYRRGTHAARLYSLVVARSGRGRGLGRALVTLAERRAAAAGCEAVHLEVRADNTPALALYARRGYEQVGRARGYYQDSTDALRLRKRLAGPSRGFAADAAPRNIGPASTGSPEADSRADKPGTKNP